MRNDITYETAILYETAINPKGAVVTENDFNNGTIRNGYSFYGFGAEINEIMDRYVEDTNRMVWKNVDRTKEYTFYYRILYNDAQGGTIHTDFGSIDIVLPPTPTFELMNIQPDSVDIVITLAEMGQLRFTTVTEESGLIPTNTQFKNDEINYFNATIYLMERIDRYRTSLTSSNTALVENTSYITYFYIDSEDKVYSVPFTTAALPKVIASPLSGTYTAPQTIELSCATQGSEIRYLAYSKGEEPAIETVDMRYVYNIYSEPFEIGEVVIYAQAWKDGVAVSAVESFEYNMKKETGGITMSKITNKPIILGECKITFKGQEIGMTEDGASLTIEMKKKAYTTDKYREAPIARTKGVPTGKLKVKFIDMDKAKLNIISDDFQVADADGIVKLNATDAGKEEIGGLLIIHPIIFGENTAYDIVFHNAFVDITMQGDFKEGGKTTVECEFIAGVDLETEKLIEIGRKVTV